jgi:predicted heme/steroid binding protein
MNRMVLLILLVLSLALPTATRATEEYARQTGRRCAACHVDPAGGGELTPAGREFSASLTAAPAQPSPSPVLRGVRLIVGYLHLITAFFWFGTILYVHLILKPTYASGGLPRGEMLVGLCSMAVMGVTGIILTRLRVGSLDMLLHSRFGILLLIKIGLYLLMVLSALFVIIVIGPRLKRKRADASPAVIGGDMGPDELAQCNGREGRPALFACNGTIYDASASRLWKQGSHMGRHQAGTDLSDALKQAPHDEGRVTALPAVGRLVATGATHPAAPHERLFYFMAYMNLLNVCLIVLILALWRWW